MLIASNINYLTPSRAIAISYLRLPENLAYANNKFFNPQREVIRNTELFSDIYYKIRRTSSWVKGYANSVKNDNVLKRFHDTICLKNNRYEISLPWVRDWKHLKVNYKIAETQLVCLVKRM